MSRFRCVTEHARPSQGRERALDLFGLTGRRAEWIALASLHGSVSTRSQFSAWLRFDRSGHRHTARHRARKAGLPAIQRGSMRRGRSWRARGPRWSAGRVSTLKRPMRRVEPERPRLRQTGLSDALKVGEPAYPLGPRFAGPRQGLARVAPPPSIPWTPALRQAMARTRPAGRAHRRQPQPPRGSFGLGRAPPPTSLGRLAEPPSW